MEQLKVGDQVVMNDKYRVKEESLKKVKYKVLFMDSIGVYVALEVCDDKYKSLPFDYPLDGLTKITAEESQELEESHKAACEQLEKLNLVKDITKEEKKEFNETDKIFFKYLLKEQYKKDGVFNSGLFNDIAIGYGKIALERMGLTGKSLSAFEREMKKALDLYDAEYARKIYMRIEL